MINQYSGWKDNQQVKVKQAKDLTGAEMIAKHLAPNMSIIQVPGSHNVILTVTLPNERLDAYLMEMSGTEAKIIGLEITLEQLMGEIEKIWKRKTKILL